MTEFKIIDKSGKWFVNSGSFRIVDHTHPDAPAAFDPGVPTKATATAWVESQPTIVTCDDPNGPAEDPKPKK